MESRNDRSKGRIPPLWSTLLLGATLTANFICAPSAVAGHDEEIKKKQDQLVKLRREIDTFEEKILESEKRESTTLELLDTYDRQTILLRKLIGSLREEEGELQRQIEETQNTIQRLGGQASFLKRQYAKYVQSAYKYGRTYDLELLLTSRSVNQALIRSQYLQRFSNQRKEDVTKLETKRESIEDENLILHAQLSRERTLIAEKTHEEQRLRSKMDSRKKLLADIRRNKTNYQREIGRKRSAARDLEEIIAKLIEEERIREERESELAREGKIPAPTETHVGVFERKRGKLPWPVPYGKLVGRFGNQQHPVLKTVTQNTGIDIAVPVGTDVLAIANGQVSTISWLPSFGNLLILNHLDGYRTVYAHLSEIEVQEGQSLAEGSRIGKSGESLSGPMVHFEVWRYREKQDPELWLGPRRLTQRKID